MIIQTVNEINFLQARTEGALRVQKKIESFLKLRDERDSLPTEEVEQRLGLLLRDPTIWAYATLLDKQDSPLLLYYYQDSFINDKNRLVLVTAANQVGKTWAVCVKALHHALHCLNASVMIISKSEQQAIMILDEVKWMMKRARIDFSERVGAIENRTELVLKGPKNSISVIRSFAPTTSALGFPATLLLCDEVDFWEKYSDLEPVDYYDQVLEPRTNFTKNLLHPFFTMGQIVMITNPNGLNGLGYRSLSDLRFHCYFFNWLSNPSNSLTDYNEAKERLPHYRFDSIYAAVYSTPEGAFVNPLDYELSEKFNIPLSIPRGSVLYLGMDIAGTDSVSKNRDSNVLYAVTKDNNPHPTITVRHWKSWPSNTPTQKLYSHIQTLNQNYVVHSLTYDKVGIGEKVRNDLLQQGILQASQILPQTYSVQNKTEIFVNLQNLYESKRIQAQPNSELKNQLLNLQVSQKKGSSHLKIHHKTSSGHDDHPDALANACFSACQSSGFASVKVVNEVIENIQCKHYKLVSLPNGELQCLSCQAFR